MSGGDVWPVELLVRLHRLKATETALLASLTPLVLWEIAVDVPFRLASLRDYYTSFLDFPRWLPMALYGACAVALYFVTRRRAVILRAAYPQAGAPRQRDHVFRRGWFGVVGATGFVVTAASEFSLWHWFYTPLILMTVSAVLVWCRSWFEVKHGFAIPPLPSR